MSNDNKVLLPLFSFRPQSGCCTKLSTAKQRRNQMCNLTQKARGLCQGIHVDANPLSYARRSFF